MQLADIMFIASMYTSGNINRGMEDDSKSDPAAEERNARCQNSRKPIQEIDDRDEIEHLLKTTPLSWRERVVLENYYFGDMFLWEIGEAIGLGEQRVSQIRQKAINKIKGAVHDRN